MSIATTGGITGIVLYILYRHFKKEGSGLIDRKKSKDQYEAETGTEIKKLVNLVFLGFGGENFSFFGLLRKRSIKLEDEGNRETYEFELVHPKVKLRKDRHPQFIFSDEDVFTEGTQIEYNKTAEGQRKNNKFFKTMTVTITVLINAILLVLELGAQPGSPLSYSYGLLRWYYLPVGEVILFLLLIYYVVKKTRSQTWVVNLIMAEVANVSKKEGKHFGLVVNGHTPLLTKLNRISGLSAETIEKYARTLTATNEEETAAYKRAIQTAQAVITGLNITIDKMSLNREASIANGGTEIKRVMPKWGTAAIISLSVAMIGLLFVLFG